MSSRKTIYLTDASEAIIGPAESLSGRINSILGRYDRLTREASPELTLAQWSMLADILNGTFIEDNTADYLWADIAESGKLDGMAEKWKIDTDAFAEQVRDMTPAARFYILDTILKFWKGVDKKAEGMAAMLEKAGAKITRQ